MKIILRDQPIRAQLYPFSVTRQVATIRIGILTIQEKWELILGEPVLIEPFHINKNVSTKEIEETVSVSSHIVPTKQWVTSWLAKGYESADFTKEEEVKQINHPWEIFRLNDWAIRQDFILITSGRSSKKISTTNKVIAPENIFLEEGAIVEHCILNASTGPIYIGKNALMMEGCIIRGPFALCEGAHLKMGTKIYGATTIGPYCIAGGEIKNSILSAYSNKAHDGYLGDSVIGEWCNLGAGTSCSNIKNTAGEVKVWDENVKEYVAVGAKCGLIMGDYSRAAINTSFNTGTVIGICCNIFGDTFPPKFMANFTWGKEKYLLEKVITDISNWKRLKDQVMSTEEKELLHDIYNQNK